MRASGVLAGVAFGALVVGFGAGWIARGTQRSAPATDDVAVDTPPRKPASSASTPAKTAQTTAVLQPTATALAPWVYPSSLPPGLCDPPGPFTWPTVPVPAQGIVRVDDRHYLVGSDFTNHLVSNQAELMKSARIVPVQQDGQTVGIKMYGILPATTLATMGFENGDLLVCLNTYSMSSPDKALEAYSKLRGMKDVAVGIVRDGKGVVLRYHVAGGTKADLENPF